MYICNATIHGHRDMFPDWQNINDDQSMDINIFEMYVHLTYPTLKASTRWDFYNIWWVYSNIQTQN